MKQAAREVGGYKAVEKIGEGGMATVYRGVQISLKRPVAIKVLSRRLTGDRDLFERFTRESLIVARLAHPNIIHVIDRGVTSKGQPYFVMEYVEGTDLAGLIRRREADFNRKLDLMIQVCKALSYAHKNGVIHRDIKPANVLIDREGNARVLDFGIAQFLEEEGDAERTETGAVMGTYAYMAPEQRVDSRNVTAASDLYSLGVVMYELFTRVKPTGLLKPPSEVAPSVPKPLEETILRCLEHDPAKRFASADEVKNRLLKLLQGAHLEEDQRQRAHTNTGATSEKFSLLDVIKEDRYGAVYLYENRADRSLLVIKKRSGTSSGYTEAKLLTNLRHESVINVLGASGNDRVFIVVMEYVSGGSLKDRLLVPMPWGELLRIGRQMSSALAFAHRNRIVHGNLRPSNILFTGSGEVKVTDFGLDEHYGKEDEAENWYAVRGEPRSAQGDIYAAGVILYQMLTGTLPAWDGEQLAPHHAFSAIPAGFQTLMTTMLARDRSQRYSSFDQVTAKIDELMAACLEGTGNVAAANDLTVVELPPPEEEPEREPAAAASPPRRRVPMRRLVVELAALAGLAAAFVHFGGLEDVGSLEETVLRAWEKLGGVVHDAARVVEKLWSQ